MRFDWIPFWPDLASKHAIQIDTLFIVLILLAAAIAIGVTISILFFAVYYHERRDVDRSNPPANLVWLELGWIAAPTILALAVFGWGAAIYIDLQKPPKDALEIYAVGKQWMWKFQHAEGRREINTLHLPVGRRIKVTLTSQDVIHSFFVPAFRTKQDVLPGRYTSVWFEPTKKGRFRLFCAEYCGTEHSQMTGEVVVMDPHEYAAWLEASATSATRAASMEADGRRLFQAHGCSGCHDNQATVRCPPLHGVFGRPVPLIDGRTVVADEGYLRESILRPNTKVVAGYAPLMPSYEGQLDESELLQIIAYLKSLEAK